MRPYFSVGSHPRHTDALPAYKEHGADEIFIAPPSVYGCGRGAGKERLDLPDNVVAEHLETANALGLRTTVLLNPGCSGNVEYTREGTADLLRITKLVNDLQVDFVVVTNPWLVAVFRELCPDVKIKISSHYNTDNIGKFTFLLEHLGADVVVVSQFANKNFKLLRQVVDRWEASRLEVMCTVPCIAGCPYRDWHATASAHNIQFPYSENCDFPCEVDLARTPTIAMSSCFVRREDLSYYQELGINSFKIGERYRLPELNIECLRYFRGAAGPEALSAILWPKGGVADVDTSQMDGFYDIFFEEICDGTVFDCQLCDHCGEYARKAVKMEPGTMIPGPTDPRRLEGHYSMFSGYLRWLRELGIVPEKGDVAGSSKDEAGQPSGDAGPSPHTGEDGG